MDDWPDGQEHLEIPAAIETQEPKELEHRLIAHVTSGHDLVLQHLYSTPSCLSLRHTTGQLPAPRFPGDQMETRPEAVEEGQFDRGHVLDELEAAASNYDLDTTL